MGETRRRTAILAAAARLFAEKGFDAATTAGISRMAGVAEGTLYHHFASKDEIFLTIFNETVDGYLAGVERVIGNDARGAETLGALVRFHFDYLCRHAVPFLIIMRDFPALESEKHSAHAFEHRKKFGRLTALLAEVLARGERDGSLKLRFPVSDTAEMLRGVLYGTARHKMLGIIDVPVSRLARIVEEFCLQALAPGTEAGTRRTGGATR